MIRVERVTKLYGAHAAVRDLDFSIAEGECVGFLGLNGAGKTTTLRILSCLVAPTSGSVNIRGIDAEASPHEIRKLIGFLPDTPPLYEEMRVGEYLKFAGRLRQMRAGAVRDRIPHVARTCGLEDVLDTTISSLSHGYKQRVGIAQAVIHEPALLILDEPIQGLDPVQIVEMRTMIRALRGQHTILLSSHILSEIAQTCDRILMLHEGRIAAQGTECELSGRFGESFQIHLEASGGAEEVRAALAPVAGLEIIEVKAIREGCTVTLRSVEDLRASISQAVVSAGIGLLGLRAERSGLESIFLSLSRGHVGEVVPGAAGAAGAAVSEAAIDDTQKTPSGTPSSGDSDASCTNPDQSSPPSAIAEASKDGSEVLDESGENDVAEDDAVRH